MTWIPIALSLAISTYAIYLAVQTRRSRIRSEAAADRAARYQQQAEDLRRLNRP